MSCSVKISCGKNWSGSQRRISSLAEETCPSNAVSTSCAVGHQAAQPTSSTSSLTTTTNTTATTTVTVAFNNPVITTTSTTTITTAAPVAATTAPATNNINVTVVAGNQRAVPPRPVKSIAAKKGEDTTKLLKYIDDNVIGKNGTFFGPFGRRKGQ
ncbi:Trna 2-thiocytidine biosynthesis protein [Camponotus japonicus]